MNHSTIKLFSLLSLLIFSNLGIKAQPGIYDEDDMAFHNKFMDAQYAKYIDKPEKQIEILQEIISERRGCNICHAELALAYSSLEDHTKAESQIKKALSAEPNNTGYLETALTVYKNGDNNAKVASTLDKLLQSGTRDFVREEQLIYTLLQLNDHSNALNKISSYESFYGINEKSTLWKLDIFEAQGDEAGQITAVQSLINAFPENTRYKTNLASLYNEFGMEKEAMDLMNEVIAMDPDNPIANTAIANKNLEINTTDKTGGELSSFIENKSIPIDDKVLKLIPLIEKMDSDPTSSSNTELNSYAKKLIELYPNESKAYTLQGDLKYNTQEFASAYENYSKASKLKASNFQIWSSSMLCLVQLEDFKKLENIAAEAVDFFPLQFDPYFYLGLSQIKNGNIKEAGMNITEAKFIASKSELNIAKVDLLNALITMKTDAKSALSSISKYDTSKPIQEFLLYETIGDLHKELGDSAAAAKSYQLSKKLGNASEGFLKKLNN